MSKKRNANVGDSSARFLFVCLWRPSLRICNRYFIDSRLNLNLLRSSSSVNYSRSISPFWNFLSRICGPLKGTVIAIAILFLFPY